MTTTHNHHEEDEKDDLKKAAKCYQPLIRKGRTRVLFETEGKHEEGKTVTVDFLRRLAQRNCFTCALEQTGCTCMKDSLGGEFSSWIPHVAMKLLEYQSLDANSRRTMKMEAIKLTASWKNVNGKPSPRLPIESMAIGRPTGGETDSTSFFICKHAYFALLAMKKATYTSLRKAIEVTNEKPEHRLKGKGSNNALKSTLQASLSNFFDEMIKLGSERTTRPITMDVDCDREMIELPSTLSKRAIYIRFCKKIGYKAQAKNASGHYEYLVEDRHLMPEEKTVVDGNLTTKLLRPPSFSTFLAFWCRNYPYVVVSSVRTKGVE